MSKVVIFGTSSFAEIAHYYFANDSDHEVVAFTVNKSHVTKENLFGLPVCLLRRLNAGSRPTLSKCSLQ